MAHRPKPTRNKAAGMLIGPDLLERKTAAQLSFDDRENLAKRMSDDALAEVRSIICNRYDSVEDLTEEIALKMDKWEKQYKGEWQNPNDGDEDKVFLPKTREQVQSVYAYIMLLVSQMTPIITMTPMVSSIQASTEEYERAKVAEALLNFYVQDVWKLIDNQFGQWLKTFLKFTMGVWKVSYMEDDALPDLKIEVVDRALIYFDPAAHELKDARWVIEKYFIPYSEVVKRVEEGHWDLDPTELEKVTRGIEHVGENTTLARYFGENFKERFSVDYDELVEIWDYWQAPVQGLDDVYAVLVGGEQGTVARYGRNPFPYKGLPYRSKSFDPHEYQADGIGMVEQYRPFQEMVNNFLNMRIQDVRKNIIRPVAATGKFIDAQTQQDFQDGQKIVRLSEEVLEASRDPGFDLRKHFVELPFAPTTQELLVSDLPMALQLGQESSGVSDVFRGQAPPHQSTLGQVQEQLSRNQGTFRPVYMQVMSGLEELAEICMEYFKSPEFFPQERIVQIIGQNRYADTVQNWHNPGGNLQVRSVRPDEMDVDVTINAVSTADAIASRTFMNTSIDTLIASVGQIPELFAELKNQLDFAKLVEFRLNSSGQDIEQIRLSEQEQQAKAQQAEQEKQRAIQEQMQLQEAQLAMEVKKEQMLSQIRIAEAQQIEQIRAQTQQAIDSNRIQSQAKVSDDMEELKNDSKLEQIATKSDLDLQNDLIKMKEEAKLEKQNPMTSLGHGNNINQ